MCWPNLICVGLEALIGYAYGILWTILYSQTQWDGVLSDILKWYKFNKTLPVVFYIQIIPIKDMHQRLTTLCE